MKKIVPAGLAFVVSCLLSLTLHADFQYLYWMVDISDQAASNPEYAFSYATVSADGNVLTLYNNDQTSAGTMFGVDGDNTPGYTAGLVSAGGDPIYAGDVSSYLGSTFLFELFNDDGLKVAWKSVSASALSDFIGGTMSTISSPYVVSNVIPEPTSGLLLLLGMAGLALKRKRA